MIETFYTSLALELNKLYTKAISRRSRAYEELKEYRKCLEG